MQLSLHSYVGTLLSQNTNFQTQILDRYSAPSWGLYRVDLQRAMVTRCAELGITIQLASKITSVDFKNARVTNEAGVTFQGDVVLGAEGLWSSARSQFLGHSSKPILTGTLAYRLMIHADDLANTPELGDLMGTTNFNF